MRLDDPGLASIKSPNVGNARTLAAIGWPVQNYCNMKIFFSITLLFILANTFGQSSVKVDAPFQTIHRIFTDYLNQKKSNDSQQNKDSMQNSLKTLQRTHETDELYLLINVWMYYIPPNFPTRELINPIFFADRRETIKQIKVRRKNKWIGEKSQSGPFFELIKFKDSLSQSAKVK